MLLIAGGLLWMSDTTPTSAWTVLLPGFILCGIGIGTVVILVIGYFMGINPSTLLSLLNGDPQSARRSKRLASACQPAAAAGSHP